MRSGSCDAFTVQWTVDSNLVLFLINIFLKPPSCEEKRDNFESKRFKQKDFSKQRQQSKVEAKMQTKQIGERFMNRAEFRLSDLTTPDYNKITIFDRKEPALNKFAPH